MKVIDLLNKIANGEIPKTIVYDENYFTYDDDRQNYYTYDDSEIDWKYTVMEYINDEIEIIEDTSKEEKKIPEKIEREEIEIGMAIGEQICADKINEETTVSEEQVLFNKLNWENQQMILRIMRCLQPCELSYEVEEGKKIPEKLEELGKITYDLGFIDYKNIETLKKYLNKDFQKIYDTLDLLIKNQNQLINYLKSKGE